MASAPSSPFVRTSSKVLEDVGSAFHLLGTIGRALVQTKDGVRPVLPDLDDVPDLPPTLKRQMLEIRDCFEELANRTYRAERMVRETDEILQRVGQNQNVGEFNAVQSSLEDIRIHLEASDTRIGDVETAVGSMHELYDRANALEDRADRQDEILHELTSYLSGLAYEQSNTSLMFREKLESFAMDKTPKMVNKLPLPNRTRRPSKLSPVNWSKWKPATQDAEVPRQRSISPQEKPTESLITLPEPSPVPPQNKHLLTVQGASSNLELEDEDFFSEPDYISDVPPSRPTPGVSDKVEQSPGGSDATGGWAAVSFTSSGEQTSSESAPVSPKLPVAGGKKKGKTGKK